MSRMEAGALPYSNWLNNATAALRRALMRVVVTVESTEEMNDVWRIYRLAPKAGAARPAHARTGLPEDRQ